MTYQILTADTVVDYLKSLPAMQSFFSNFSSLKVQEIGDGNVNFVYRIKDPVSSKSVILKQAVPYLRVAGESFPLTRERMNVEIMALKSSKAICPDMVPTIYYSSKAQSLVIMEDLANHQIIRGQMIKGIVFPGFAGHMANYLAKTLFYTSDLYLQSEAKKALVADFINPALCKLTEDFVFSHPYENHPTNTYNPELSPVAIDTVQEDRQVKIAVAQMKHKFMNEAQALIHGDLHIGSIMANAEQTYVIDPEFAFFGPMGFDVGALIGNLYMNYFSHGYEAHLNGEAANHYRRWLLDTVSMIWQQFSDVFTTLWLEHEGQSPSQQWQYDNGMADLEVYIDTYMASLLADSIGFAACKMMRRVVGLAKVADFADIKDLKLRARIEQNIIAMAAKMIVSRGKFSDIDELNVLAQQVHAVK
jgi:5-methylthioribose kinase